MAVKKRLGAKLKKELGIKWLFEERDVDDLIPFEDNPRIADDHFYNSLVKSFEENGDFGVFIVDHNSRLIGGHQRKRALQEFKVSKVLVKYPDRPITDEEFLRINLLDNKLTADWDYDVIANCFDPELVLDCGFDPKDLGGYDPIIDNVEPEIDPTETIKIEVDTDSAASLKKQISKVLKGFAGAKMK